MATHKPDVITAQPYLIKMKILNKRLSKNRFF